MLYVKMLITLLYLSVMWQHIVCVCICCIYPLQGSRSTGYCSQSTYFPVFMLYHSVAGKQVNWLLQPVDLLPCVYVVSIRCREVGRLATLASRPTSLCLCCIYPLQGSRSTGYSSQSTYFPASDATYTHTHDMLPHHR